MLVVVVVIVSAVVVAVTVGSGGGRRCGYGCCGRCRSASHMCKGRLQGKQPRLPALD